MEDAETYGVLYRVPDAPFRTLAHLRWVICPALAHRPLTSCDCAFSPINVYNVRMEQFSGFKEQ